MVDWWCCVTRQEPQLGSKRFQSWLEHRSRGLPENPFRPLKIGPCLCPSFPWDLIRVRFGLMEFSEWPCIASNTEQMFTNRTLLTVVHLNTSLLLLSFSFHVCEVHGVSYMATKYFKREWKCSVGLFFDAIGHDPRIISFLFLWLNLT